MGGITKAVSSVFPGSEEVFDIATGAGAAEDLQKSAAGTASAQIAEQRRQFDISQKRLEPFIKESVPAFQLQAAFSGAQGPEAQAEAFANFRESPGVSFLREQGLRELGSGFAATGGLGGGQRLRELQRFGQGLAEQSLGTQFNRLGVVSGAGQTAGAQSAQLGAQTGANVSAALGQQGLATQQAIQGQQQQVSSLLGSGAGFLLASDVNLKTDIREVSDEECFDLVIGLPLQAWRYLEETGLDQDMHFGPMAQDCPEIIKVPGKEALSLHDEIWMIAGAMRHFHELLRAS